jgi:phosphoesterase RecJ-like protein
MELPITTEIATCLFTGLMTDTGGFRYSNTDTTTFSAAAHLVACGAEPSPIAQNVYESRKPQSIKLIGEVYASLKYEFEGRFVWNEITQALYSEVGGDDYEPDGLASDIRGIEGVEMSALFHETPEGHCRVGLRSRGLVNVSALAQMLGGGGHHNASGAYMRGEYIERRDWALGVIREYLKGPLEG